MASRPVMAGGAAMVAAMVLPIIQQFEGTVYKPYKDINGIPTVCSGHTSPTVIPNKVYSAAECLNLTQRDIDSVEAGVLKFSPNLRNHEMQLVAAVSFSYNVGVGAYDRSSVAYNFNKGNYVEGCKALLKYSYAGNRFIQVLYNRRKQEYNICMSTLTGGSTHVAITR